MREMRRELGSIIYDAIESGKTPEEALMMAGEALLKASQELVPVDTGTLKESGYVQVTRNEETSVNTYHVETPA
jgi:CRISPR/Cas system-associated exonuclease Cas4 (RecB family)